MTGQAYRSSTSGTPGQGCARFIGVLVVMAALLLVARWLIVDVLAW